MNTAYCSLYVSFALLDVNYVVFSIHIICIFLVLKWIFFLNSNFSLLLHGHAINFCMSILYHETGLSLLVPGMFIDFLKLSRLWSQAICK